MNQSIEAPIADSSRFLTAEEAAAALGVRRATLYAYVSRGLLHSVRGPDRRARRYPAAEVEALRRHAEGVRDPAAAARDALSWGEPVLESRLTLIAGGRLHYRGLDATELARRGETLERTAALLWLGDLAAPLPPPAAERAAALARLRPELAATRSWRPFDRLQALWPLATAEDAAGYDLRPPAVAATGAWLLGLAAALAAGSWPGSGEGAARRRSRSGKSAGKPGAAAGSERRVPAMQGARDGAHAGAAATASSPAERRMRPGAHAGAAATLAAAWARSDEEARRLLDAALVLSADHELNVSAFTARCVASAGAPPQAAVAAGLAALGGTKHGGYCNRVEAMFSEASEVSGASAASSRRAVRALLAERLRRGEEIPGFGQRLYPGGDPRAALLVELAAAARPRSPAARLAAELAAAASDLLGERPNLDFGLVTLAHSLDLPPGAALAIFAVGRTAGWIAHALEQYADPRLIRPRARYLGPEP
jgi:citrate synthase